MNKVVYYILTLLISTFLLSGCANINEDITEVEAEHAASVGITEEEALTAMGARINNIGHKHFSI